MSAHSEMPASRPLHAVFLERVIRIEAVQRERAQVTEEYAAGFFDAGRLLGELDDFCWSLDEPELFSRRGTVQILGVISPRGDFIPDPSRERTVSPAMQRAWEAAVAAWRTSFVAPLRNGQLIANARYPATGERHDLDRAEWLRTGLRLDVHDGTLFTKDRDGKPAETVGGDHAAGGRRAAGEAASKAAAQRVARAGLDQAVC